MEVDACWDEPSVTDVKMFELFGSEDSLPSTIDHRGKTTTYNQFLQDTTKMACGSYWIRHIINLSNKLTGGTIDDPQWLWNRFCNAYTTSEYIPEKQGSSLQDQMKFARKLWLIEATYKIPVGDWMILSDENKQKVINSIKTAIDKKHFIYTGSRKIDWKKTRASKDKVAVIGTGSPHIIMGWGYNDKYLFIQQSSWDTGYDKGWMYLKWEDIGSLFSVYGVIDRAMPATLNKIARLIEEKKKHAVHDIRPLNGRNVLRWRPK